MPAGATSLIAKLEDPTAPDFDMYVGTGAVSAANVECQSASGGSIEAFEIANPAAGTWWVLVQNWEASTAGGTDTADLGDGGRRRRRGQPVGRGPDGPLRLPSRSTIRTFWDERRWTPGRPGTARSRSARPRRRDIGVIPVTVNRIADDVTKTADASPRPRVTRHLHGRRRAQRDPGGPHLRDHRPAPRGHDVRRGLGHRRRDLRGRNRFVAGDLESTCGAEGHYPLTTAASDPDCVRPGYPDLAASGGHHLRDHRRE